MWHTLITQPKIKIFIWMFRICSWGSIKYIFDVKVEPFLQGPYREPSMSFKYLHQWQCFLDTLLIMLDCLNVVHRSGIKYQEQCLWSGTFYVLQATDDDRGVLYTLLIMLECWNSATILGIKCQEQWWPTSSMSPVRNSQCSSSHWWCQDSSWQTSNHALFACGRYITAMHINQPDLHTLTCIFQEMIIEVSGDHLWYITSPYMTKGHQRVKHSFNFA